MKDNKRSLRRLWQRHINPASARHVYQITGGVFSAASNASAKEIRKVFRREAKEYYPNLHPNKPVAARKMNEVNGRIRYADKLRKLRRPTTVCVGAPPPSGS